VQFFKKTYLISLFSLCFFLTSVFLEGVVIMSFKRIFYFLGVGGCVLIDSFLAQLFGCSLISVSRAFLYTEAFFPVFRWRLVYFGFCTLLSSCIQTGLWGPDMVVIVLLCLCARWLRTKVYRSWAIVTGIGVVFTLIHDLVLNRRITGEGLFFGAFCQGGFLWHLVLLCILIGIISLIAWYSVTEYTLSSRRGNRRSLLTK